MLYHVLVAYLLIHRLKFIDCATYCFFYYISGKCAVAAEQREKMCFMRSGRNTVQPFQVKKIHHQVHVI